MWKRLWKNAILALCVLALVLQPITCFAAIEQYGSYLSFNDAINNVLGRHNYFRYFGLNVPDYNFFMSGLNDLYAKYFDDMGIELSNDYLFNTSYPPNDDFYYFFEIVYTNTNTNKYVIKLHLYIDDPITITKRTDNNLYVPEPLLSYQCIVRTSGNTVSEITPPSNGIRLYAVNNTWYAVPWYISYGANVFTFNASLPPVTPPDLENNTGVSTDTSVSNVDWNSFSDLFSDFLTSNFYFNFNNTLYNSWYVGVAEALTYEYLCKSSLDSPNVFIVNKAGEYVSLSNPYYYLMNDINNVASNLAQVADTLENANLSTIASSISTINNKLDAAFPSNQASINDFIAEDLMDDTGGNGLTINRIAQSKSDLDDGLDTFKLDISQSQYSNPFSALGDADWSFWSQTTLNNLGSGYSYSFSEGSLMSEDDIFTENQNDLLYLLGW